MRGKAPRDRSVLSDERRRRFLQAIGVAGVAGVAGCLGDDDDEADDTDDTDDVDDSDDTDDADDADDTDTVGQPHFDVASLDPSEVSVAPGDSFDVAAEILNTGDAGGEAGIELRIDGDTVADTSVSLDIHEDELVEFTDIETDEYEPDSEHTFSVHSPDDYQEGTLTIEALPELDDSLLNVSPDPFYTGGNTITGELNSSYNFSIQDGAVSLAVPDGWEITDESGTSFTELEDFGGQEISWDIAVPDDASGEYELEASISYAHGDRDAEFEETIDIEVLELLTAPWGINNGNEDAGYDTVTIDGLTFDDEIPPQVVPIGSPSAAVRDEDQEVENTEHDPMYLCEHWGEDLGFEINIEPGDYEVTFHWAEGFFDEPDDDDAIGGRVFDVYLNGEQVIEELDIYDEAGGPFIALTYTFTAEVSDGPLVIETDTHANNTMFNGIEIRDADDVLVIEDFERASPLDEYYGNTDDFSIVDDHAYEGEQSLRSETGPDTMTSVEGLPTYPEAGDTFAVQWYFTEAQPPNFHFGVDGEQDDRINLYDVGLDTRDDDAELELRVYEDGDSDTLFAEHAPIPEDEWLEMVIDWGENGDISIAVYDEGGDELLAGSANDDTYTDGGIGFRSPGSGVYWDYVRITEYDPASRQYYWTAADYDDGDVPDDAWEPMANVEGYAIADDDDGLHLSLDGGEGSGRTFLRYLAAGESSDTEVWAQIKTDDSEDGDYFAYLRSQDEDDPDVVDQVRFDDESEEEHFRLSAYEEGDFGAIEETDDRLGIDHGEVYNVRARAVGDTFSAKWWPAGADEPDGWTLETDAPVDGPGWTGLGHWTGIPYNVYAWSVGINGVPAPRSNPADLHLWTAADYDEGDTPDDSWTPGHEVDSYDIEADADGNYLALNGPDTERTFLRYAAAGESTNTEIWARLKSDDPEDGDYYQYLRGMVDDDGGNALALRPDDHAQADEFRISAYDGGFQEVDTTEDRLGIDHGEAFEVRARAHGNDYQIKWWAVSDPEPNDWTLAIDLSEADNIDVPGPGYTGLGHWTGEAHHCYAFGVGENGAPAPRD